MMFIACVMMTKMHVPINHVTKNLYLRISHYWEYGIKRLPSIYKWNEVYRINRRNIIINRVETVPFYMRVFSTFVHFG